MVLLRLMIRERFLFTMEGTVIQNQKEAQEEDSPAKTVPRARWCINVPLFPSNMNAVTEL